MMWISFTYKNNDIIFNIVIILYVFNWIFFSLNMIWRIFTC
jgi:hypothetical protein